VASRKELPAEDLSLLTEVADSFWTIKDEVELLASRSTISPSLRAALLASKRDAQRIKDRLEAAAHPRKARRKAREAEESEPELPLGDGEDLGAPPSAT